MKTKNLVTLLALVAATSPSQTREKRIVPIDSAQRPGFETRRHTGVAILVGVGNYPRYSGLSTLRYPDRDVDLLEKELTAQRYTVVTLKDGEATRAAILNAIKQAGEVLDPASGVMLFFFSGHGFAEGTTNFLATHDASSTALSQTGLAIPAVEKALTDAGATRRVLWIDACRNEPGKGAGDNRTFTRFDASAGTRILFSTKAGRISYEDDELQQGLFSYYLLKGLQGEAARDVTPGTAGTPLTNSQCTIANAGAVTTSGNNMTIPLNITFASGFGGTKLVYGYAINNENQVSGWTSLGTWIGH